MQQHEDDVHWGYRIFTNSNLWLIAGAIGAFLLINIDHHLYEFIAHGEINIVYGGEDGYSWDISSHFVAVDILMALFFFVVGAELKIDFTDKEHGSFQTKSDAVAPFVGAIGGVAFPAAICAVLAGDMAAKAFGVPMATDIAFTLAIANMFGLSGREQSFLKALAVIDDIIGVLVIAVFYGDGFEITSLMFAIIGTVFLLYVGWKLKWHYKGIYLVGMIVLWKLFYDAGIHPTLAGVVAGFAAPHDGTEHSTAKRIERVFNTWAQPWVLCFFAFVSCGIYIPDLMSGDTNMGIISGIGAGLLIGKPLGITLMLLLLMKLSPSLVQFHPQRILTMGAFAGFGFTVALFVNGLAFDTPSLLLSGVIGILAGSLGSVVVGGVLHFFTKKHMATA